MASSSSSSSSVSRITGVTPSPEVKKKLDILLQNDPAILEVRCFPNADATIEGDVPSGTVFIMDTGGTVNPDVISDNMFQLMAVSNIHAEKGERLNEKAFEDRKLLDKVQQYPEREPSGKVRSPIDNTDIDVWESTLGGPGGYVGIYSKLTENGRDKQWYIAARGTVPQAVQDLKADILAKKPTYRQLLNDEDWRKKLRYADYLARRNVLRNIVTVAREYKVTVKTMDDHGAYRADPDHGIPERAEPQWEQSTYSIRAVTHMGKPAVAIYNGVVPKEDCQTLTRSQFFVVSNPYDGIVIFPLTRPISAIGLPCDTGRRAQFTLDAEAIEARASQGVTWEGDIKHHPDLAPDAFHPISDHFKDTMKQTGGWNPEHHLSTMIPACVKIWNDSVRRN